MTPDKSLEAALNDRVDSAPGSPLRALITLYIWFIVLILCGLSSLAELTLADVGAAVASGCAVLTLGAFILALLPRRESLIHTVTCACFMLMLYVPQSQLHPRNAQWNVLFDLYLILLVVVPSLLRLWSWKYQAAISGVTLLAVGVKFLQGTGFATIQSLLLAGIAAALSTLVLFVRKSEFEAYFQWRYKAGQMLEHAGVRKLPQQVWSTMLLTGGLFVVLIFLDLSLGGGTFSAPIVPKLWGLIIVVLGCATSASMRPKMLPRTIMLTLTVAGLALSAARIEYGPIYNASFSVPLIFLMFVTASLHWPVEFQVQFAWAILCGDLAVKMLGQERVNQNEAWFADLGEVLHFYRPEIAILILGGASSVIVSNTIRSYRMRNLSFFNDQSAAVEAEGASSRQQRLLNSSGSAELPERNHQLLFGIFCLGILSSALSSKLLFFRPEPSSSLVVGGWITFLGLWGGLAYHERSESNRENLWGFGAALTLLLLLWPTMLLLTQNDIGNYWLFWPTGLLLGIGLIPWSLRELLPMFLIIAAFGTELTYRLSLGVVGGTVLFGAGFLSVLLSVQCSRRIRERYLFTHFHEKLLACKSEIDVLRTLADYLIHIFDGQSAFISAAPDNLEFIRGDMSFLLDPPDWPLLELRNNCGGLARDTSDIGTKLINWLPDRFNFFDPRVGVISPSCGLLVEVGTVYGGKFATGKDEHAPVPGAKRLLIFVNTSFPLFVAVRKQELIIARMLAAISKLKITSFYETEEHVRLGQMVEVQASQREYELSALVHDINNTVQDLTLLCEMIVEESIPGEDGEEKPASNPETVTRVKRIAAIARSVATVVSDAKRRRELERLEDLTPRELVEVCGVIREIVSFAAIRADRKRISINEPVLPDEDVYVRISVREHLETILRNLLNNAIMYSQPGSMIEVNLKTDDKNVWIVVQDNGAGLTGEECESIFLPGFRGKASAISHQSGLGLGLAESLRVARAAGGNISAISAGPGSGSAFTVELPRQPAPIALGAVHSWALLVDDQPALTDFYSRIARAIQLQPETASSVEEALSIVRLRGKPGLVVTDIHLGNSNGLDLVVKLRAEFGSQLPIIVISGLTSEEIMTQVRSAGATDFVAKPVGRRALFARIQSLLTN